MTPEERAKQVCSYRNLRMIETLRAEVANAIRQAIQEEREALVSLVMNDAYAASFQTLAQYRVALKDAIRDRK